MAFHTTFCLFAFPILFLLLPSTMAESETYIIHMDPSVMPKAFSSLHSWYLATLSSALQTSSPGSGNSLAHSRLIYTYTEAIHGFSASVSPSEHKAIKNSLGYVSSVKDMELKLHTSNTPYFLGLNSMFGICPKSDFGKGVIIGVVDGGAWPESKSYKDDGMWEVPSRWRGACEGGTDFNSSLCNKKLIGARYFNKGVKRVDPDILDTARDDDGHGTHTSSTAAGSPVEGVSYFEYAPGTTTGVAPKAHVAVYKAFWDGGGMSSDILAAMDQAIADGVDVLSGSFGPSFAIPAYEDFTAIAAFAAMEKGIFVSMSAGNDGPRIQSLGNEAPWLLSVAASTVSREFTRELMLGNGVNLTGLSLSPGPSTSETSLVIVNCLDEEDLKGENVTAKFVVCIDKDKSIAEQVRSVTFSKAAGGIFITNDTNTYLEIFIKTKYPAVFLDFQDGDEVLKYINSTSSPRAKIGVLGTLIGRRPAPVIAEFSSRGPAKTLPFVLKPDLTAPGSSILASWAPTASVLIFGELFNDFNIISGTSMSCPHAAGVAALLKGAYPEWSPAAIRSAMMTTADVLDHTQSSIKDDGQQNTEATPLAMGAGHINPNKALDPGLIYDIAPEDYVNLLCALNLTSEQIKTITRSSSYNCSNPSLDINYPSFIGNFSSKSEIQEFQRTVTNVGDGMSEYTAKLSPMPGFKVSVVPEKLIFKEKNEKQSYKLTVESRKRRNDNLVHASLSWIENGGNHVVRSPIVATRFDPLTEHN